MNGSPARRRTVAIFTGNRAEYGQMHPVIKAIAEHPALTYHLIVSGAHLERAFGRTKQEIEADGFRLHREFRLPMSQDTPYGTARAIATGILCLSEILEELRPDFLVVSGDRFEAFAAAVAGTQMNIATAHIEGGDITEGGSLDDSTRHAMTKLAHLHFTTNTRATDRVLALGEEPWRVQTVGLPILDLVAQGHYAPPEEVAFRYQLDLSRPLILFTQHSVATEFQYAAAQIRPSLEALHRVAKDGYQVVITFPNNDAGGHSIIEELEGFATLGLPNVQIHKSLGRHFYHGMLNVAGRFSRGVCAGNSSSGIKETPAFGCPTVNIGPRQRSRLRGANVLDVEYDATEIEGAIRRSVQDDSWRARCGETQNPYGKGNAGKLIAEVLSTVDLNLDLVQKKMMI